MRIFPTVSLLTLPLSVTVIVVVVVLVTKTLLKSFDSIESLLQFTLCDIMDRVNIVSRFFDKLVVVAVIVNFHFAAHNGIRWRHCDREVVCVECNTFGIDRDRRHD